MFRWSKKVRTKSCAAFTLVEMVFVSLLVAVLFFILYYILYGGSKNFRRGTNQVQAINGALMLADAIEIDCCQLTRPGKGFGRAVNVSDGGRKLTICVARGVGPRGCEIEPTNVTYVIDETREKGTGRVYRDGKPFRQVYFKELFFELVAKGDEAESTVDFLRFAGTATDRYGRGGFIYTRLYALPVPAIGIEIEPDEINDAGCGPSG